MDIKTEHFNFSELKRGNLFADYLLKKSVQPMLNNLILLKNKRIYMLKKKIFMEVYWEGVEY